MMRHRKREHPESARMCREFENGGCDKDDDNCWFLHKEDFQMVRKKIAPPLRKTLVKSVIKNLVEQNKSRASQ